MKEDASPSELPSMHSFPKMMFKSRLSSEPIPIGNCHTVSGHEAMDLAKRLSEELAAQQSNTAKQSSSLDNNGGGNRVCSPECEPQSRSFDQQGHAKKGNCGVLVPPGVVCRVSPRMVCVGIRTGPAERTRADIDGFDCRSEIWWKLRTISGWS